MRHSGATQSFEIVGARPAPQGSKSLMRLRSGRSIMVESSRMVKPWRSLVANAARDAGIAMRDGPVAVSIVTRWTRPASHYGKRGLRATAAAYPGYADCDKLARAIFDALAGIAYRNDRQVVRFEISREWCGDGEAPGAFVTVSDA